MGGLAISFDPDTFKTFSPDLLPSLAQHANQAFTAAMQETTARVIRESFDQGLSVPDTARAIRGAVKVASPAQATMLARTDLISIANGGSFMAARQVYPEPGTFKQWLATADARTRPTHSEASGQVVPLEAPFRVGGFELMYPGDPQGPPGEVIQCRCTFTVRDSLTAAATEEETMPYHTVNDHGECPSEKPVAVVKDSDGEVMGCHANEDDAQEQIAAIEANESATAPAATLAVEPGTGLRWRSVLVLEGEQTDDGRLIDPGALDWRDLPLTLMAMVETSAGGHEGANVAGRIDSIERVGNEVIGEGVFDSGDFGAEVERMVGDQTLRGVSVDLAIREFELRGEDGQPLSDDEDPFFSDEPVIFAVTDASIMGATVCPFPAFADANIVLLADATRARIEFGTISLIAAPEPVEVVIVEEEDGQGQADLVADLRSLLADSASMATSARGFHWNVQGSDFSEASALFAAIAHDLSGAIDQLAGSIRQLGGRAPVSISEIADLRAVTDASDLVTAFDMTANLKSQNDKVLASLRAAFVTATNANEQGIANFLADRIDQQQRWEWQLRVSIAA